MPPPSDLTTMLDHKDAKWVAAAIAGVCIGVSAGPLIKAAISALSSSGSSLEERSTTSSAGGGTAAYETRKAVDEYLQFHFGDADLLPYPNGPQTALNFTARLAQLCKQFCTLQPGSAALDVGCAVGGASFELARFFDHVTGIDYSHAFVLAAQDMQQKGTRQYSSVIEGDITQQYTATVPKDIPRANVEFQQGDACDLSPTLPQFDAVLAANLLCRLPDPMLFINRLPSLVKPGGVAVLVSPYSWLPGWTTKANWLGAKNDAEGKPLRSAAVLAELMQARGFELVHQEDMPFLIREHARKYQWGCSHACVWRRVAKTQ